MNMQDLFNEYECDFICVTDLGIIIQGARLDYIEEDEFGKVHFWAGNPETDKYAEEIVMSKEEEKAVCEIILEEM